ncbi:MAG TPA: SDR family NAD(P)-dependent oxidoreductase [Candidatus Deferrimicrobiaceae bacterium]|nr:SDR family NAD(P)-dependent oxidoreductase [Candidatus Deferrimicrobiaceae bacterium]
MADPRGRVALVTGASSGIGAATARAFAGAGLRVALCARRKDRLERLAADLTAQGAEASVHAVDVTDAFAVPAMVDAVTARWGRLDVLVNNAGRGFAATLEQTTAEELRALMELNVVAVLGATQAVLPIMRRQGSGHIINVSSIVGRRAVPYRAAYSATKFALGALSETLRVELTGSGIAVTLVYPIRTVTEFHQAEVQKVPWRPMGPVQSAERVARSILSCVRRPRPEVYPYWPVRVLAVMSVIAPGLVDRGMRRVLQR